LYIIKVRENFLVNIYVNLALETLLAEK
jgi:hypothetical protein